METKVCSNCKEEKPLNEFGKQSKTKDGLKYRCKKCDKKDARARYLKNSKDYIIKIRDWQKRNPEKQKQYFRRYLDKIKKKAIIHNEQK